MKFFYSRENPVFIGIFRIFWRNRLTLADTWRLEHAKKNTQSRKLFLQFSEQRLQYR